LGLRCLRFLWISRNLRFETGAYLSEFLRRMAMFLDCAWPGWDTNIYVSLVLVLVYHTFLLGIRRREKDLEYENEK
jgi:hypothetical protein